MEFVGIDDWRNPFSMLKHAGTHAPGSTNPQHQRKPPQRRPLKI
jgi:hypothetical protein